MMKKLMAARRMPSLDDLFKLAKEFKVKFFACSTSCGVVGLERENMIE